MKAVALSNRPLSTTTLVFHELSRISRDWRIPDAISAFGPIQMPKAVVDRMRSQCNEQEEKARL